MKVLLLIFVCFHGLIHLTGFFSAFNIARVKQWHDKIPKTLGIIWLTVSILFFIGTFQIYQSNPLWWIACLIALILSQVLIIRVWKEARVGTLLNIFIFLACILGFAQYNFYDQYRKDVNQNLISNKINDGSILTDEDLKWLPAPVKKYLYYTKSVGKPKVYNFKVEFAGKIRKDEYSAWLPFHSEQ